MIVFFLIGLLIILLTIVLIAASVIGFVAATVLLIRWACDAPRRRLRGETGGSALWVPLGIYAVSVPVLLFVAVSLWRAELPAVPDFGRAAQSAETVNCLAKSDDPRL